MVTTALRQACAEVAQRARYIRIDADAIPGYAATLRSGAVTGAGLAGPAPDLTDPSARETAAAFWLTLDAINFGSGWFPTLRRGARRTGYRTIEAGVKRRFEQSGPWTASELAEVTADELAALMEQDPEHELLGLFAESLRDLGRNLAAGGGAFAGLVDDADGGGAFAGLVDDADGSAVKLVETLAGWRCFADVSTYDGIELPFLKRAQIAAADLHRAGVGGFTDVAALTMFADNLVPHVLRLDGVLSFDPGLVTRIDAGELIEHESPEEVEIRACAVHAVELIVAASPPTTTAAEVDEILWNRGQQAAYKAVPRHRSRTTAY